MCDIEDYEGIYELCVNEKYVDIKKYVAKKRKQKEFVDVGGLIEDMSNNMNNYLNDNYSMNAIVTHQNHELMEYAQF